MNQTLDEQFLAMKHLADIRIPLLFLLSREDAFAKTKTSETAFEQIPSTDKKLLSFSDTHHPLLELEGEWQRAEQEAFKFMTSRVK